MDGLPACSTPAASAPPIPHAPTLGLLASEATATAPTCYTTRTVRVRDDVDDSQAVKTLAHELGHVLLPDNADRASDDRPRTEIEAESVAYLVCHQLGIVSDDYSFAYLARWSNGDTNLIRTTAKRAITCARRILTTNQTADAARVA